METADRIALALIIAALSGHAQAREESFARDVRQQQRIENGLKSGALSTAEAARLQRQSAQVSRLQAHSLADGSVSAAEAARLAQAQNDLSRSIYAAKHDAQRGDPHSVSSQRMQASVARNIQQTQRIKTGLAQGSLSAQEAARLEQRQARLQTANARAGHDGHISGREAWRLHRAADRQSAHIYRQKHDRNPH